MDGRALTRSQTMRTLSQAVSASRINSSPSNRKWRICLGANQVRRPAGFDVVSYLIVVCIDFVRAEVAEVVRPRTDHLLRLSLAPIITGKARLVRTSQLCRHATGVVVLSWPTASRPSGYEVDPSSGTDSQLMRRQDPSNSSGRHQRSSLSWQRDTHRASGVKPRFNSELGHDQSLQGVVERNRLQGRMILLNVREIPDG